MAFVRMFADSGERVSAQAPGVTIVLFGSEIEDLGTPLRGLRRTRARVIVIARRKGRR